MEKLVLKSAVLLACLALFSACGNGKDVPDSATAVGFDEFSVISGSLGSQTAELLSGSGWIRFNAVAPSNSTAQIINFRADLPVDGSSVTLVGFASPAMTDGLHLRLERVGAATTGRIILNNGTPIAIAASSLAAFSPNNLDLAVEMHNAPGTGVRIYIWNAYQSKPDAANAILDTTRSGTLIGTLPAIGATGTSMGLIIDNANVTRARLRPAFLP